VRAANWGGVSVMLEKTKAWTARRRSGGVKAESARRLLSKRLLVPVVGVGVGMALYYRARTANRGGAAGIGAWPGVRNRRVVAGTFGASAAPHAGPARHATIEQ
jgi:hypothetical protein